ncbi:uncharacterized protein METZ01_LOCUS188050 [marine metagenome]|uniref:Uncharacterized protein n=1 Tax=marine metagenome TaxID=408172 RepID=A0A382D9N0_9ZZZZ
MKTFIGLILMALCGFVGVGKADQTGLQIKDWIRHITRPKIL